MYFRLLGTNLVVFARSSFTVYHISCLFFRRLSLRPTLEELESRNILHSTYVFLFVSRLHYAFVIRHNNILCWIGLLETGTKYNVHHFEQRFVIYQIKCFCLLPSFCFCWRGGGGGGASYQIVKRVVKLLKLLFSFPGKSSDDYLAEKEAKRRFLIRKVKGEREGERWNERNKWLLTMSIHF